MAAGQLPDSLDRTLARWDDVGRADALRELQPFTHEVHTYNLRPARGPQHDRPQPHGAEADYEQAVAARDPEA